jgi:hypothetical protein
MEKQNMKIEVFSAGCFVCDPVVEMVKSLASTECEVIIYNLSDYNLSEPSEMKIGQDKVEAYGIKSLPAIAVNGKLLSHPLRTGLFPDSELSTDAIELSSETNHSLN